jgi:predicted nucleic acid-binding protein
MNIVDTSGWLEYLAGSEYSSYYEKQIEHSKELIVPTIIVYEVFKKLLGEAGEDNALKVVGHMQIANIAELDMDISLFAAKISWDFKVPMADSIILATGYKHHATIYTHDEHFTKVPKHFNVRYFEKSTPRKL